ncbi:hypothetical protein EXIGLDRAFT_842856 [Exidia glandulosa HHB12029]|uniref:DUF6534 domain-containing protein n=1 Tax=Exidia glandulosa HHB12029 TaxID=1314781 RepID=A0A165D0H4_EXIGL|nr:hypothetical protein EXIGLDRAFT_842856 [Exidia glandulosa HHB12029]
MAWTALGSVTVGILLNFWLYGVVCHMYATYWTSRSRDFLWMRLLVPALFIIDTVQTAADGYFLYVVTVQLNHPDGYTILRVWPCQLAAVTQSLSAVIVTLALTHRLYRLTKNNRFIGFGFAFLAVAVFCVGFTAAIKMWTFDFSKGLAGFNVAEDLILAWHSLEVALNFLISGALIYVLSRSRTGFKGTDSLINSLIRGAVQTGCFSSIFSLIVIITYTQMPVETSICLIFILPLGRVYSVTLMDTVISREMLKRDISEHSNSYATHGVSGAPTNTIELRVRKEVSVYDGDRMDTPDKSPISPKKAEADAASSLSNIA